MKEIGKMGDKTALEFTPTKMVKRKRVTGQREKEKNESNS